MDDFMDGYQDSQAASRAPFVFGTLLLASLLGGGAYWFLSEDQTQIVRGSVAESAAPIVTARVADVTPWTTIKPARQVYFAYDEASLTGETRGVLDRWAERLAQDKLLTIQIEGHADERGSTAYNLGLGERRGEAVRDYLVAKGINEPRLKVVSFGETRPAELGHDENAWTANRRVEFRISNVVSQN